MRDRSGNVYKPGTLREYRRALRIRVLPEFGAVRLSVLARADVQEFVDRLLADVPFAPETIARRAKRAWAASNKLEREASEREGRKPDLLVPMTLHECRHTFASLLIDAKVNAKAVQEFMGHATIEETFSRYGHLMPGARDQARELVDAYMQEAMGDLRGVEPEKVASGR